MWPEFLHFLRKVVCTLFRNLHFYSRDLYLRHFIQSRWASLELQVTKLACDQVVVQATSLLQKCPGIYRICKFLPPFHQSIFWRSLPNDCYYQKEHYISLDPQMSEIFRIVKRTFHHRSRSSAFWFWKRMHSWDWFIRQRFYRNLFLVWRWRTFLSCSIFLLQTLTSRD